MTNESTQAKQDDQELTRDQMDQVAAGDGTTQHFFTTEIFEGRVASIKRPSPDVVKRAPQFRSSDS